MSHPELFLRAGLYLASCFSLALLAWALADAALPRSARVGLRLLAVIAGQLVLTALLVQSLGLLGLLKTSWYLTCSLAPGLVVCWFWWARRPPVELLRLVLHNCRLWIRAPRFGFGWLALLFLLFLVEGHLLLPGEIDALTLHGPLIVEWIQSGQVTLGSHWNYPQCWEYQFAPLFLLLRSDVLVVLPALSVVLALALAVRELAGRLRLGGRVGQLLGFVAATIPVLFRDLLKNDTVFAFALLLAVLALERVARRSRGSFWLIQLAVFWVLGSKPSGFTYAGLLLAAYLLLALWRRPESLLSRLRALPAFVGFTFFFQASAVAVQARNFWVNGNPVFPLRLQVLGREIFAGPIDQAGTSILDYAGQLQTWRHFVFGGSLVAGLEWPLLLLLLLAALGRSLWLAWRIGTSRQEGAPAEAFESFLPWVIALLWLLFFATPWSAGLRPGSWDYLAYGNSFRYAIAPLALTYLVAAAMLRRLLPRARLFPLLAAAFPLLIFWKWSYLSLLGDSRLLLWKLGAFWLLLVGAEKLLAGPFSRLRTAFPKKLASPAVVVFLLLAALLLASFAVWVESRRTEIWAEGYREVWTRIWQLPGPAEIAINEPQARFRYLFYGPGFRNRLVVVPIGRGQGGQIPDGVAGFYLVAHQGEEELQRLIAAMEERGFRLVAIPTDRRGAWLERR